jgi:hypothetical protein
VAKNWSELGPRARRLIVVGGTIDTALKVVALVDLSRRPAEQVRGSKRRWAWALTLVNSAGVLPVVYLLRGRVSPR